jgi:hypothetical protein
VNDAKFFEQLRTHLKKHGAEEQFPMLKRVWERGGREATIQYMATHNIEDFVTAFDKWVETHQDEAAALAA